MIQLDLNGVPLSKWERIQFVKITLQNKTKTGYYSKCAHCEKKILNLPRLFLCVDCLLNFYVENHELKEFTKIEVVA